MPPADSKKPPLTPEQIELLRKWIDAGAKYEPHWAYIPPQRPAVPAGEADADWPRNDIDRFLLAKLEAAGIDAVAGGRSRHARPPAVLRSHRPAADAGARSTSSLHDKRPDAYEQLVDRLLASPAYGERMATWWFDLVRFADTVGYHGDQDHRITPYRDYVIKSFNDNLPFDQFTIEQLAGDLLPNPTMWQLVATGYNRVLQTTHEGGAQDGEYRAKYLADRVRNFSETWLAGSMGCAECHDHKFDPYTQEDFYSLAAFFADVDQYGSFAAGRRQHDCPRSGRPRCWPGRCPCTRRCRSSTRRSPKLEAVARRASSKATGQKRRDELIELKKQRRRSGSAVRADDDHRRRSTPREIRILPRGNWMDKSGPGRAAARAALPAADRHGRPPRRRGSTWRTGSCRATTRSRRAWSSTGCGSCTSASGCRRR